MSRRAVLAVVAVLVTSPIASWWLIGDRSTPGDPSSLDYAMRAPRVPYAVEAAVGLAATIIGLGAVRVLVAARRDQQLAGGVGPQVIGLAVVGLAVAFASRVVTAGRIGANIGGGLVMMLALPLGVPMLFWVGATLVRMHRGAG